MTEIRSDQTSLQELLDLLAQPKKANAEWQAEAGRLVNLAHLRTLATEASDLEYLTALALCKWAQVCGVIGAKNKSVQAVRFRTREAPPLAALPQQEVITHALILLSDLRADWCKDYVTALVAAGGLNKNDLKTLGKWAIKVSKSISGLVEMLVTPSVGGTGDVKTAETYLKAADKLIDQVTWRSCSEAAKDCGEAVLRIAELLSSSAIDKKLVKQLWSFTRRACDHARKEHPIVLLESDFLKGISALAADSSVTQKGKDFKNNFSSLMDPTLSCLASLADRGGREGQEFCGALIPLLIATYPEFSKRLSDAAARSSVLAELQTPGGAVTSPSLEDAAASVYAGLLPIWHEFYSTYAEAEKLSVMNANLLEAASLNCVEFMGQTGEVVDFDPVAHRVQDGGFVTEKRVRLIRPTIVFRRSNGSYRVVLPALVSRV